MGLFDLFKKVATKKEDSDKIQFTEQTFNNNYDPWAKTTMPRNDNYAIAGFVAYSQHGGNPIGKSNDDYPRYFSYKYYVNDPIKYHKQVIADGYLTEADAKASLKQLTVAQLKEILLNNNLPDKGKKDELIERIIENIDTKTLNLPMLYVPSPKGYEHLDKYNYFFEIEKYNISINDFEYAKEHCHQAAKTNDIIWKILNTRYNECNLSGDFGSARNELYYCAEFLKAEQRFSDALYYYILVLYYDLSGCSNGYSINIEDIFIAPGIASQIFALKEYYVESIPSKCYRHSLPHHYLKQESFSRLINDIFEDKVLDVKNYIRK